MVVETIPIQIRLKNGEILSCAIELSGGPPWKMILSGIELCGSEVIGEDLFTLLGSIREKLEKIGAQTLCAGARPEVFPSGMSRAMSGGRKAYVARLGSPALTSDLVDIFDYASPETVGSVAEQKEFREKWAKSLRL